jgi:hypothetical protein
MTAQEAVDRKFADRLAASNDNAEPSAFAYTMYAKAPERIVALANAKGWKTPFANSPKPAASSATAPAAPAVVPPATPVASTQPAAPAAQPGNQEPPMADVNETEIRSKATADAQARIQAILTSAEAKGREAMAQHLAFTTAHSAEDAIALLKVAPQASEQSTVDPTAEFVGRKTTAAQGDGLGAPSGSATPDVKAAWGRVTSAVNKRVQGAR